MSEIELSHSDTIELLSSRNTQSVYSIILGPEKKGNDMIV